ncbi:MAG: glycerate kinase [Minwuia sp.]|nr:glycerate kinase [Minwuia sp.]
MNAKTNDRALLERLFQAAVARVHPARCVPDHLPDPPKGRTVVVGAGKAAAAMASAFETAWQHDLTGLVITRYGFSLPTDRIEVVEASHPVPDESGIRATRRILDMVRGLGPDDLVVCLLSGGASALLTAPADGLSLAPEACVVTSGSSAMRAAPTEALTLADKQAVTQALLRCGAPIQHINTVRKHLSAVKGGGLARAAAPARVVTLAISDVVGDDPAIIGSGPTVADPSHASDALALIEHYGIRPPAAVMAHLRARLDFTAPPMPPSDYRLIARPQDALDVAAKLALAEGLEPVMLGDGLEGEARDVACAHGDMARRLLHRDRPSILLSGGELTVTVKGDGQGGPNQEYALALALVLDGCGSITALAADTDGLDGVGDAAGAFVDTDKPVWNGHHDSNPAAELAANNAGPALDALGALFRPGPTNTNVNDFRAIIVRPPEEPYLAP